MKPLEQSQNIMQFIYRAARLEENWKCAIDRNRGLSKRIFHLNKKVAELEAENAELLARVKELEAKNDA